MIAQIDEKKLPMIALTVDPPGQPDFLTRICQAQGSASMGSVSMHQVKFRSRARTRHDRRAMSSRPGAVPHAPPLWREPATLPDNTGREQARAWPSTEK